MSTYRFQGLGWRELAAYFDIKQEKKVAFEAMGMKHLVPESVERTFWVNQSSIRVSTQNEDEVVMEKLKEFLREQVDWQTKQLKGNTREVLNAYLDAVIQAEDGTNCSTSALQGIRDIKEDSTFLHWFVHNLLVI